MNTVAGTRMPTEAGEHIVGAYLQHIYRCGVILYNARPPGGKLAGLSELDVIGLNLRDKAAFLCEVTTHLHGMRPQAVKKIEQKHVIQMQYAAEMLPGFSVRYMLWSPRVFPRQVAELRSLTSSELVVNEDFTRAVEQLRAIARKAKHDTGNPFMRTLQILEHLRVC